MKVKVLKQADETWLNRNWRPMMGWTYIAICIFDFIIMPSANYFFFGHTHGEFQAWKSLTMSDGGLFHLSMGAVLGITSWTRGREKINRYNYGGYGGGYEGGYDEYGGGSYGGYGNDGGYPDYGRRPSGNRTNISPDININVDTSDTTNNNQYDQNTYQGIADYRDRIQSQNTNR